MKCLSCDCILSDREATRKSLNTGEFIDLCNNCFSSIEDEVISDVPIETVEIINEEYNEFC